MKKSLMIVMMLAGFFKGSHAADVADTRADALKNWFKAKQQQWLDAQTSEDDACRELTRELGAYTASLSDDYGFDTEGAVRDISDVLSSNRRLDPRCTVSFSPWFDLEFLVPGKPYEEFRGLINDLFAKRALEIDEQKAQQEQKERSEEVQAEPAAAPAPGRQ